MQPDFVRQCDEPPIVGHERQACDAEFQRCREMNRIEGSEHRLFQVTGPVQERRVERDHRNGVQHLRCTDKFLRQRHWIGEFATLGVVAPANRSHDLGPRERGRHQLFIGTVIQPIHERLEAWLPANQLDQRIRVEIDHRSSASRSCSNASLKGGTSVRIGSGR